MPRVELYSKLIHTHFIVLVARFAKDVVEPHVKEMDEMDEMGEMPASLIQAFFDNGVRATRNSCT